MRVLVIHASPKGESGHTAVLTRAFLSGFPQGTEIETLELRRLNIRPCLGCLGCWTKTPGKCVQKDDMEKIYAAIERADVIVESFPLYFYGLPGTLKTMTDRCLPYTKAGARGRSMSCATRRCLKNGWSSFLPAGTPALSSSMPPCAQNLI